MRFDFVDLRLFLLIVETGTITGAAAKANMALASASARLRGMEETIGLSLLERGRRGVSPTAAGDALAHHARIMLRQMERLRGELGEFAQGLRGQVRLHANTAAMAEFLPGPLGRFLAEHSGIDIDLKERMSREIVATVAAGRAEIGIVSDTVDPVSLRILPFATDRLVLVLTRNHPLARQRSLALRAVEGEQFVGLGDNSPLQDHVAEEAARSGLRLSLRARVRTFEGVCRMAAEGAGVGIVPASAAARCKKTMGIAVVRLADPWATRRLVICVRDLSTLSRPARALVDHLYVAEDR